VRVTPSLDTINSLPIKADQGVEREPDIAFGGGSFAVVWSEGELGGMHTVRVTRVTTQGVVIDSGIPFGDGAFAEYRPSIAFDGARFLAVWYNYVPPYGVFGRFLDALAQPVEHTFEIRTSASDHVFEPDIAFASGRYLVVWSEQTSISGDDVYGQIIDPGGTLIGNTIPIAVGSGYQSNPRISGGDNEFLVVWHQNGRIFGQIVSMDGQVIGDQIEISDPLTSDRTYPDIVIGPNNCLVAWMQYANDSYDIYGNVDLFTGVEDTTQDIYGDHDSASMIINGSLIYLLKEHYTLYDISGRMISCDPAVPGIYFAIKKYGPFIKIVKVR
jgi:hypothetical protein